MLVIDPHDRIDCAPCVPECPVAAIVPEEDGHADQRDFIATHATLARLWPPVTRREPAPPDADEWANVTPKRAWPDRRGPGAPD